jgi:hypothetical protein
VDVVSLLDATHDQPWEGGTIRGVAVFTDARRIELLLTARVAAVRAAAELHASGRAPRADDGTQVSVRESAEMLERFLLRDPEVAP